MCTYLTAGLYQSSNNRRTGKLSEFSDWFNGIRDMFLRTFWSPICSALLFCCLLMSLPTISCTAFCASSKDITWHIWAILKYTLAHRKIFINIDNPSPSFSIMGKLVSISLPVCNSSGHKSWVYVSTLMVTLRVVGCTFSIFNSCYCACVCAIVLGQWLCIWYDNRRPELRFFVTVGA